MIGRPNPRLKYPTKLATATFVLMAVWQVACAPTAIQVSNAYSRIEHTADKPRCIRSDAQERCALYSASLIELIANPGKFHRLRVQVVGYLDLQFEGNAVYLSRESLEGGVVGNGLWLDVEGLTFEKGKDFRHRYVLIEGTFNAENGGHMGLFPGALEQITRVTLWR